MKKTIITVVGKDTVGIIARVCTYLAENKVNILDISQTIVDDYFNMMMIADMSRAVNLSAKCPMTLTDSVRRSESLSNAREKRSLTACTGFEP